MSAFRICRIETYNFKGFHELSLDLSEYAYFILGGKNGYGKTTIFDAIELVITGEIQRLSVFNEISDKRGKLSDFKKPLVHDMDVDTVSVEILVEKDGYRFWLKREARTKQMTNPLSFEPFRRLYLSEDNSMGERAYREISEEELTESLSQSFVSKYGFIYYLDQENSDQFIKSSSKLRREKINSIFNIESFDSDLEKFEVTKKKLGELLNKYDSELTKLRDEKMKIVDSLKSAGQKNIPYVQLADAQGWDSEKPRLDIHVLTALFGSNGILTEARYYIQNRDDYKWFCLKRDAMPFQNEQARRELAVYIQYANEKDMLELYEVYSDLRSRMEQNTDLEIIEQILLGRRVTLGKYIEEDNLRTLIEIIADVNLQTKQLNDIQKHYLRLCQQRDQLTKNFESSSFHDVTYCPLCGNNYGERVILLDHISRQGDFLRELVDRMGANNLSRLSEAKRRFKVEVLDRLGLILSEKGIDSYVFNTVRNSNYSQFLSSLTNTYGITIEKAETYADTYDNVMSVLTKINEYDGRDIDFNRIESFHLSRLHDFNPSMLSIESIDLKRDYILSQWSNQSSEILVGLERNITMNDALLSDIKNRHKTIDSIIREIKKQKQSYIQKLISDIEILFYIYSGRIMQNCHYGRGVFLKYDAKANVLFTAGGREHDVDVLLNMSSGQISAVIISFMLALNKLYADHKFIAIDDPVQTMDDMNIWGLIETLRHEFHDYTVLMSTHEQSFGSLIRYKTSKMGIPSYYLDMRLLRSFNQDTDEIQSKN